MLFRALLYLGFCTRSGAFATCGAVFCLRLRPRGSRLSRWPPPGALSASAAAHMRPMPVGSEAQYRKIGRRTEAMKQKTKRRAYPQMETFRRDNRKQEARARPLFPPFCIFPCSPRGAPVHAAVMIAAVTIAAVAIAAVAIAAARCLAATLVVTATLGVLLYAPVCGFVPGHSGRPNPITRVQNVD